MKHLHWLLLVLAFPLCGCNAWNNLRDHHQDYDPDAPKPRHTTFNTGAGTSQFGVDPRAKSIEADLGVE